MDHHQKKPTVYIETTVVSYYTARTSSIIKIAGDQEVTREWWDTVLLPKCEPRISIYLIDEISKGNKVEAEKRLNAVSGMISLEETKVVKELAQVYLKRLSIPKSSELDAFHLAISAIHDVNFLVSWNCNHIANAFKYKTIRKINDSFGLPSPEICTPLQLMGRI